VDEREQLVSTAIALAQTAESVTVPAKPQLLADGTTAETVTSRMAEQGGRIAVMSAEGDIFAGRYSGKPNMGVFLNGHAGDRLKVDRQTREEYIEHPALTMGLCAQPQVLDDIGGQDGFKGRGLLSRFLYSVPESLVGRRKIEPDPIPEPVRETYRRNVLDLTLFLAEWTDPALIQLTPEAVAALKAFQARVEPMLEARGGIMGQIGDWGGKLVGATARVAALLHLPESHERAHGARGGSDDAHCGRAGGVLHGTCRYLRSCQLCCGGTSSRTARPPTAVCSRRCAVGWSRTPATARSGPSLAHGP
jgi:hypothetical protein